MSAVGKAHDLLTRAGYELGQLALVGIVALYCYEVVARYFFANPTTWSSDMVGYLLCCSVFAAMPEVTRRGEHIAINLLEHALPQGSPGRRVVAALVVLVSAAACLFVTWVSLNENIRQYTFGVTTMSALAVPQWWVSCFITYGFLSSSLYFLRFLLIPRRSGVVH